MSATTSASGWRRVDRGKGHSYYDPSGELVRGVTTLIGDGVPKPALVEWAAKSVAEWAGDYKDELAGLPSSSVTKKALAHFNENRYGPRDRGKTIHELAEYLIRGEEVDVPDSEAKVVDALERFLDDWKVEPVAVESVVVSTRWHYAGTLDLVARVTRSTGAKELALLDWKTGRSGVFPEAALQLAAYAHADFIVRPDGAEVRLPAFDLVAAVWLQDDGYQVVPVNVDEGTFYAFLAAAQVADTFTKRDRSDFVLDPVKP